MIRTRTLAVAQISGKGIAGYVTVDTATSRRRRTIVAPHATDAQVGAPRAHMLGAGRAQTRSCAGRQAAAWLT